MTRFAADIAPTPEAIARLTADILQFLRDAGVDGRAVHHVALVVEEILTNVASHGGNPDAGATVAIELEPDRIIGRIGDWGRPFDPRTAPAPDTGAPIEERATGGLGLHLVRQLSSALDYRRDGQQNWTSFCILRGHQGAETHGSQ
jgi:anti-sigma regulatory factor (Ser/Thr protein kinase)